MIGGKWRLVILYWLVEHEAIRFNELQRKIGTITYKTLSTELKAMEADGLVIRKEYPQIPPKVEYSLSSKGRSLLPIRDSIACYAHFHNACLLRFVFFHYYLCRQPKAAEWRFT